MNPVLMLFLDGVGVGNEDYEFNPFFRYGFKTFSSLLGEIPSHKYQIIYKCMVEKKDPMDVARETMKLTLQ